MIRYRRDGLADLSWTCTQSADGRCEQCKAVSSNSCGMYTLSISTTEDAASSGASLPSNSDCKYGDTIELTTSSSTFILYELAVIAKEGTNYTEPYDLLNQYIWCIIIKYAKFLLSTIWILLRNRLCMFFDDVGHDIFLITFSRNCHLNLII